MLEKIFFLKVKRFKGNTGCFLKSIFGTIQTLVLVELLLSFSTYSKNSCELRKMNLAVYIELNYLKLSY